MLKKIWNRLVEPEEAAVEPGLAVDREKLKMLVEHFPIGRKVQYYPEYKREILLQTIIVGYRVNDQFVYARDAIRVDAAGLPVAFLVGEKKVRLPVEKLRRLQLVVPDTTDMERSLDYVSRATIGRAGQFRQGNTISLIADIGARGLPTVDTMVDQRVKLIDGPFKDERMILLEPVLATMTIEDQRRKERVETDIPVDLHVAGGGAPVRCVLGDFSDNSLRLRIGSPDHVLPPMDPDDEVIVVIYLGDAASTYRIKGLVFRGAADTCVIKIAQLYKDGEFANFKVMDLLEIKSGLLNYRS